MNESKKKDNMSISMHKKKLRTETIS